MVDISVGSRFWAFDLARELDGHAMLGTLHTGYPAFMAGRFGLRRSALRSVWTQEPLNRVMSFAADHGLLGRRFGGELGERFDRIVARRIRRGSNIFVGWSNQCLRTLEVARRFGMRTIVERGSTHIAWQRQELAVEADRLGLRVEGPDEKAVAREEEEYHIADYIAVPSSFAAATFLERGTAPERILVNPYGVDLRRFGGERSPPVKSVLRVLHVGRVSVRKGIQYLIPAVAAVAGSQLTMVGPVDRGLHGLLKRSSAVLVGPVPGPELPQYYARADVFCLLTLEEGFALVLLQAMAMGLPVITTERSGGGDIITDGVDGFIVPARDPQAAAVRLAQLAADPRLGLEMGRRARARVQAGFGWSDYGARARSLYRQSVLKQT